MRVLSAFDPTRQAVLIGLLPPGYVRRQTCRKLPSGGIPPHSPPEHLKYAMWVMKVCLNADFVATTSPRRDYVDPRNILRDMDLLS
jgi:hypothetical protein